MAPVLWSCTDGKKTVIILAHHPVSWFNARSFAYRIFLSDEVKLTAVMEGQPEWELQWVGSDAGAYPDKRMQCRKPGGEWENT